MQDAIPDVVEDDLDDARGSVPGHFWAVVAVGFLWNSFGALDYTMTKLGVADWTANVDPRILATIAAAPVWATIGWALGVWGSFAGAVLLLMRSRHAVTAFTVSLLAALVSFGWQFSVEIVPTPVLPAVIILAVAFFRWYAARMRERGVLR